MAFRLGNIRTELDKASCPLTLDNLRRIIIRIREEKLPDPAQMGNAGSFFMNPVVSRLQFEALQREYPEIPHYIWEKIGSRFRQRG